MNGASAERGELTRRPQQAQNASVRPQFRLLLGLVVLAVAMVAYPGSIGREGGTTPVSAQGFGLSLDTDISDGPCTDIDSGLSTSVGESFQVAICIEGLPLAMAFFQLDVSYDDTILSAPEVANGGLALDDNPDANAGATTWGAPLGEANKVDCSSGQVAFPSGDRIAAPGEGSAFISCLNLLGPWPLGDEAANGALAVITFKALKEGSATLTLTMVQLGDSQASELASCNPIVKEQMFCKDATVTVAKEGQAPTAEQKTAAPTGQPAAATPTSEPAPTASSEGGGGRDWLLPTVVGVVAAVVVVGLLSLAFYRRRRQAA